MGNAGKNRSLGHKSRSILQTEVRRVSVKSSSKHQRFFFDHMGAMSATALAKDAESARKAHAYAWRQRTGQKKEVLLEEVPTERNWSDDGNDTPTEQMG